MRNLVDYAIGPLWKLGNWELTIVIVARCSGKFGQQMVNFVSLGVGLLGNGLFGNLTIGRFAILDNFETFGEWQMHIRAVAPISEFQSPN